MYAKQSSLCYKSKHLLKISAVIATDSANSTKVTEDSEKNLFCVSCKYQANEATNDEATDEDPITPIKLEELNRLEDYEKRRESMQKLASMCWK